MPSEAKATARGFIRTHGIDKAIEVAALSIPLVKTKDAEEILRAIFEAGQESML